MSDIKALEKKIEDLEARLKRVEETVISPTDTYDKDLMDAFYKKARELVVKHQKATPFFLQRKLLIDFERATRLLDLLQANGVVGPATGAGSREILVSLDNDVKTAKK